MATNVSTTNTTTTNSMTYNPYGLSGMSNDFFGSQIFGNTPSIFGGANNPRFTKAPNDLASQLVQEHAGAMGNMGYGAPTMQDFYTATQIANMFSNNPAVLSPYTSFTQNDIFAQQYMFGNGQFVA